MGFTITETQKQYKIYSLSDSDADSHLEVVPERGGIVTQWSLKDREIFYLDKERFTHPDLSVRGGLPILFPLCGNLPDNTYSHNGKQYTLKQHGFARELPWEVTSNATENGASLSLVLNSSDATRTVYPFDFRVTFTYTLRANSLTVDQVYHNLSDETMPFSTGFHPYFQCGNKSLLEFDIPSGQYLDQKTKQIYSFAGKFDLEQEELDFAFGDLRSQSAKVKDHNRKLELSLEYDPTYVVLVFWTVRGKDFYCLEPWTAGRNSLNTGENLTLLAPHTSKTTSIKLTANFL